MSLPSTSNVDGSAGAVSLPDKVTIHQKVIVHPIVLLSAVDHYNRVAKNTRKRVVGILLGEYSKGVLDVTNSYAVPFEEDERDLNIWFLDHSFHEAMFSMFKKVSHAPQHAAQRLCCIFACLSVPVVSSRSPCAVLTMALPRVAAIRPSSQSPIDIQLQLL